MTRQRVLVITSFVLTFGAGWIAAVVVQSMISPRISSEWFELAPPPKSKGISYSTNAFLIADIPLPNEKGLIGTGKFISDELGQLNSVRFGYKVSIEIEPLDLSKVPAKYLKEKKVDLGGGKSTTQMPIDVVVYSVKFEFTLKDKDGFTLIELPSAPHDIYSGKTNRFQAISPNAIPVSVASRTKKIVLRMFVDECVTCKDE